MILGFRGWQALGVLAAISCDFCGHFCARDLFGSEGMAVLDLTGLDLAAGFIIQGDAAGDLVGGSVADAGYINGDGFADIIVGA